MNIDRKVITDESTGIPCCSICGKELEKSFTLFGQTMKVACMCNCQKAEAEALDLEMKRKEFEIEISHNRSVGLTNSANRFSNFSNDKGLNPKMHLARKFVEHWEENYKNNLGLLLWGRPGTGKSFFAGCIANALLDRCIKVMMTDFPYLINEMNKLTFDGANEYLTGINANSLLIIDDLGTQNDSKYNLDKMYQIINSRYVSGKPLIITTNLSLEEIANAKDDDHKRIYDRILQMCKPIELNDYDFRGQAIKDSMEEFKAINLK